MTKKHKPNYVQVIPSITHILDDIVVAMGCDVQRLLKKSQKQILSKDDRKALTEYTLAITRVAVEQDRQKQKAMMLQLSDEELLELLQTVSQKLLGDATDGNPSDDKTSK